MIDAHSLLEQQGFMLVHVGDIFSACCVIVKDQTAISCLRHEITFFLPPVGGEFKLLFFEMLKCVCWTLIGSRKTGHDNPKYRKAGG